MNTKIRWIIARIVNRLFEDVCWARLVMWAIFPEHDFYDVFDLRHTAGECARLGETNYCGKCEVI